MIIVNKIFMAEQPGDNWQDSVKSSYIQNQGFTKTNFSGYCHVNTNIVQRAYYGSSFIVFRLKQRKKNSEFRNFHSFMIYSYYLCKRMKLEENICYLSRDMSLITASVRM